MDEVSLDLKSRKKWCDGSSRINPPNETLDRVMPLMQKIGVTRLANITHLDILRIPNYSAVLPGTEDYIWVYSGKGPSNVHAKTSAVMESIERYCSLPSGTERTFISGSYDQLIRRYQVPHPDEVVEPVSFEYRNDMIMDFLQGFDLLNSEQVLVPAPLSLFRYTPKSTVVNPFAFHHTNGLASGNVIEDLSATHYVKL